MQFAKLYPTPDGQVLIKIDQHERTGKPEVRCYVQPEGMGVCSVARTFADNEAGWLAARMTFDAIDETQAKAWAVEVFTALARTNGGGN